MATIIVNGQEIQVGDDERLNGIQAAARAGFEVPHYCWHPGLSVVASCRMCLVETGRRDPKTGQVSMMPKVVPACQTPATDGTIFVTNSEKVAAARAMVEEDLLLRHPIDCPICDKAGECALQDYHFEHGREQRRADIKPFTSRRRPVGDTVTLFVDRCVMCTRCVRFTREIAGTSELMVVNRGAHEEIDVFPGFPLSNKLAGNVVDLCPVGALGDKDFLYRQRVWFMERQPHVCGQCSTGCSIHVDQNQDRIYRFKPRENPFVNQWWMCDEGRYSYGHVHDSRRVVGAHLATADGLQPLDWTQLPSELDRVLRQAKTLAVSISPFLTVEEAYLLVSYARQIDPQARIGLGQVPVVGQDERFQNGFTIHAEKCPNRRGIEQLLQGLTGSVVDHGTWRNSIADDPPGAVWVTGGYPQPVSSAEDAEALASVGVRIVQDLIPGPLWETAHYRLPSAAWPERSGSYVNVQDRLQSFEWAVRPPRGVLADGQLLWRLSGRQGLYQPRTVLSEISQQVGYFAAAAQPVPAVGIDLKVNQLVHA
ncbi:MAG: 2Fe-2S iron-sulfur cluster-binding protein [Pirellulales bacterium]